ncbi:hypothetical protein CLOP_g4775 [Closterium sp. NIES-67]|nr:hypothetical protein CLOP_g4775 [Closterium sp. NIES-67]
MEAPRFPLDYWRADARVLSTSSFVFLALLAAATCAAATAVGVDGAHVTRQHLRSMSWQQRQALAWACARSSSAAGHHEAAGARSGRRPWYAGVAMEGRRRLSGGQREAFERRMQAVLAAMMARPRTRTGGAAGRVTEEDGGEQESGGGRRGMESVEILGARLRGSEHGGGRRSGGAAGDSGDWERRYNVGQVCAELDASQSPSTVAAEPVRGFVAAQQRMEAVVRDGGGSDGWAREKAALVEFRAALTPASQQVLKEWSLTSTVPMCRWTGVVCSHEMGQPGAANATAVAAAADSSVRRTPDAVVGVVLSQLGLQGTISSSLASLPSLQYLVLSENELSSSIPSSLVLLPALTLLDLSINRLSGTIPSSLSRLSALVSLMLSGNQLSGSIPATLGALPSLRYLYLGDNSLSSSIPASLGRLSSLSELALGTNRLSGSVPLVLSSLTALVILDIVTNRLAGPLPSRVFSAWCPAAFTIEITGNAFSGHLPDFSACTGLVWLDAGMNAFSGSIPSSVSRMASLEALILLNNSLSASLPLALASLPALGQLDLSRNNLSGRIPPFCASPKHASLRSLRLSGNQMSGAVPASLGRCGGLENLFLDDNRLSGSLPATFRMLRRLRLVRLERNRLWGPLPLARLENITEIWLDGNALSGPIPLDLSSAERRFIYFSAPHNRFSGALPASLGQLVMLDLSFNRVSGPIPPAFMAATANLSVLLLPGNRLSGSIPAQITSLTALKLVDLSRNALHGALPANLAVLSLLQELSVDSNNLTGAIPPDIAQLPGLMRLDLSNNRLSGTIPQFLGAATAGVPSAGRAGSASVAHLLLGGNELSGSIPDTLSTVSHLLTLNLSANHLSGSLPSGLAALQQLTVLDVSINALSGSIPSALSSLSSLQSLNLSSNLLSGPIPAGPLPSFPLASYANNSALCGVPISASCSVPPPPTLLAPGASAGLPAAAVAGIVAASVCVLAAVAAAVCAVGRRREEKRRRKRLNGYLLLVKQAPVRVTVEGIVAGTRNFSDSMLLGKGGFGSVYKCSVPGTQCTLAIKRLHAASLPLPLSASPSTTPMGKGGKGDKGGKGGSGEEAREAAEQQANREVQAEVRTLGQLEHQNLVRLYGAYVNVAAGDRWLIYEYVAGGSLEDLLRRRREVPPGEGFNKWEARLSIAMGLTKALKYLHHECSPYIIHRDIKPSNILVVVDARGADGGLEGRSSEGSTVASGSGTGSISGSGVGTGSGSGTASGSGVGNDSVKEMAKGASETDSNSGSGGVAVNTGDRSRGACSSIDSAPGNKHATRAEALSATSNGSTNSAVPSALLRLFPPSKSQQPPYDTFSASHLPHHESFTPHPLSSQASSHPLRSPSHHLPASAPALPSSHPSSLTLSSVSLPAAQPTFTVRVADFGLARQVDVRASHMSTAVLGTYGYMAPEYAQRGRVTTATDVFAFGVVLLQLVSGRSPYDEEVEDRGLARWAFSSPVSAVLDPLLGPTAPTRAVEAVLRLALRCMAEQSQKRPSMLDAWTYLTSLHDVVAHMQAQGGEGLELSLEQQSMAWDSGGIGSGSTSVLPGSRAEKEEEKGEEVSELPVNETG